MSVRVRFAPSPTGHLHVGGARTALFNYLFAKNNKGSFILRIEDTDQDRHQETALLPLLENLKWLGLDWDEGPVAYKGKLKFKGPHAPYRQKDRLSIYREKAKQLISEGKAYYCFMSPEEEAQQKEKAIEKGKAWRVSSPYRRLSLTEAQKKIQQGEQACIRFKTAEKTTNYIINDLVRGKIHWPSDSLGDFILIRTDGFPVYNFSCALDDGLMKITHIFRGEEHLSNTLKQKLIQEALAFPPPKTGHLSIILGKDKKKLSKRSGSESLEHYKKEGYLPQALINFLALLGWNPGTEKEFFSKKELIQSFNISRLNLSAAVFDENKLLWLNEKHIQALSEKEISNFLKDFLTEETAHKKELKKLISPLRSGFKTLKQAAQTIKLFMDQDYVIKESAQPVLKWPKSKELIEKWQDFLKKLTTNHFSMEDFKHFQKNIQKEDQIKGKEFFMPLRCALMGQPEGVEIKTLVSLLEKEKLLKRAEKTLKYIKGMDESHHEAQSIKHTDPA